MARIAETLEQRLAEAIKEKWSYSAFFEMLLTDEIERRNNKQLTLRLGKSRLDQMKTMETFDFKFNPKVQASLIRELCLCAFNVQQCVDGPLFPFRTPSTICIVGYLAFLECFNLIYMHDFIYNF